MNDKFEDQKEKLISIKHEISLLYQQVNYLLRNGKTLELLDLDVLMNRTHTLYNMLCSINLGGEPTDEELAFDAGSFTGLFGGLMQEEMEQETDNTAIGVVEESDIPVLDEVENEKETTIGPSVEPSAELEVDNITEREPMPMETTVTVKDINPEQDVENIDDTKVEEKTEEDNPLGDEFGFFFRFENMDEVEDASQKGKMDVEENMAETESTNEVPGEVEGKVVHVMDVVHEEDIPERDRVHGEDLIKDNPFEMPSMDDESTAIGKEEMVHQNSLVGFFEQDDTEFELSTGETLGEKMITEDNSLAAKLQHNSVRDLRLVIGINDKFLFVNELFGGSMEKYNKSIENLNDLKTLNGAMIYLNELKIELQWNKNNEAYLRLKDLVASKYE